MPQFPGIYLYDDQMNPEKENNRAAIKTLQHLTLTTLQPILDSIADLENVWLKFIDHRGEYILTARSRKQCSFCRYIRSSCDGNRKCLDSCKNMFLLGKHNNKPYFGQCHAGLTIVSVPIEVAGQQLGYLAFGEIKENNTKEDVLQKVSSLKLSGAKLIKLYRDIPLLSQEHVAKIAETLSKISNCFINIGMELEKVNNINFEQFMGHRAADIPLSMQIIIQNAKEYIIKEYNKPVTLTEVAGFAHINSAYFSHVFKLVTGYTFKNYLTRLRIEKAKELLVNSSLAINQISREIGYEDSNYFSRVFKKMTGAPPRAYLNNQRKSRLD